MKLQANILSQGYYQPSGSSVTQMLQNKDMPILDLFIREVLQNSLDASFNGNDVKVDIVTGSFSNYALSNKFEVIDEALKIKYGDENHRFLAVRDYYTKGLTGDKNGKPVEMDETQNLAKLVFHIMKPQPQEGKGGSTGIGKTIYYRMGNGLVIYYTRILVSNSNYEERLVASLIEDEKKPNSLLKLSKKINNGVAFFGINGNDKDTFVIDDSNEIHRFLSIFGLKPYTDNETGTTVLIPYIDDMKLLQHNVDENQINGSVYWRNKLEDYLEMATIRWYFPRMSKSYKGSRLIAYLNGNEITIDETKPIFYELYQMYENFLNNVKDESLNVLEIKGLSYIEGTLGNFIFKTIDDERLKLLPPHNFHHPFVYINKQVPEKNNVPIILYIRKPGMIISYDTGDKWNAGNIEFPLGEHFFGFFILNSEATFKENGNKIEEYIRKGEKSDHTEWTDHDYDGQQKRSIVQKIRREIGQAVRGTIEDKQIDILEQTPVAYFGKKFANLLLPPSRFGRGSSGHTRGGQSSTSSLPKRQKSKINLLGSQLEGSILTVQFEINQNKLNEYITIEPTINTSEKSYLLSKWTEMGFKLPITLNNYSIQIEESNPSINDSMLMGKKGDVSIENGKLIFSPTKSGNEFVGIIIHNQNYKELKFILSLEYQIINSSYELGFKTSIKVKE